MPAQNAALTAVNRAAAAGRIDHKAAAHDRAEIVRAGNLIRRLPSGRREHVAAALEQIACFPGRLTGPRAVALFGQLRANDNYFARHSAPAAKTNIVDADGVVYRYFPGTLLRVPSARRVRRAEHPRRRRGTRAERERACAAR